MRGGGGAADVQCGGEQGKGNERGKRRVAANRLLTAGGRAGGEAMDWQRNKSGLIMNVYLGKLHKKIYKLIRYGLAGSCPRKP